jgi:hypothetical protein
MTSSKTNRNKNFSRNSKKKRKRKWVKSTAGKESVLNVLASTTIKLNLNPESFPKPNKLRNKSGNWWIGRFFSSVLASKT